MDNIKMVKIATMALAKNLDFEQLKYSDDMYGNEDFADDVWEYVEECEEIGSDAFKVKYDEYKPFFTGF